MIDVQGLGRRIGAKTILDDVHFSVAAGEIVALLGPSGCGKSSTLRVLAGLDAADEGVVRIGDRVVDGPNPKGRIHIPAEQRGIAMVFQGYALWPHMTVADNIAYPLLHAQPRVEPVAVQQRVDAILEHVQLTTLRTRLPGTLSGGQQQRVALARALVARPPVLLLDEPLANLDAVLREELRTGLGALARDSGAAVVLVTHDRAEAFSLADRIVLLNAGQVVQTSPPVELYRQPSSRFVMSFTGAMSSLPANRLGGRVHVGAPVVGTSHGGDGPGWWCVRPEQVHSVDTPSTTTLVGIVAAVRFIGDGFEIDVMVNDTRLGLLWRAASPPMLGSSLHVDVDQGCFFST
jgi:ABC-type Fe3+/spermidine/putrescine transport system ATPase subunit